jgi:hypothetical protein
MKNKISVILNLALVMVLSFMVFGNFSVGNNPGGSSDPIVTQSYVEARIQALNDSLQTQISGLTQGGGLSDQGFEVIAVSSGQTIYLNENSQFILRTGEGTAIAGEGGGLADLTSGIDLTTGDSVPRNHLILIARTDGRGIVFLKDAYIMVRGGYELK